MDWLAGLVVGPLLGDGLGTAQWVVSNCTVLHLLSYFSLSFLSY